MEIKHGTYRRRLTVYAGVLRFALVAGLIVGAASGALMLKPPLMGALFAMASTATDFVFGMALIGGIEIFLPRTALGRWLADRPFLVTVLLKVVAYLGVLALIFGTRLGPRLVLPFVSREFARQFVRQGEAGFPVGTLVTLGSFITFLLVMLRHAMQLVGERSFRDIVLGRYHRPRLEERFFLFVDIVGSTPVAERLGPLAVHRYLDRVFQVAADPVDDCRGEVYQYVGDEMVITWPVADGKLEARALACFFAIEAALERETQSFEREFGTVPKLRGALHAGETVTGEIGGSKRAIVFHGDVMNTTSRIENATRELGRPFLVSEDALQRLDNGAGYRMEDLGPRQLRGKEARLRVYAASRP